MKDVVIVGYKNVVATAPNPVTKRKLETEALDQLKTSSGLSEKKIKNLLRNDKRIRNFKEAPVPAPAPSPGGAPTPGGATMPGGMPTPPRE